MKRLLVVVFSLLILFVSASPAAASSRTPKTCWPKYSETYRINKEIRIFRFNQDRRLGRPARTYLRGSYIVCDRKTSRWRFHYIDEWHRAAPFNLALSGHFVALVGWEYSDSEDSPVWFLRINTRSGKTFVVEEGAFDVVNLFLGASGQLAYSAERGFGPESLEIRRFTVKSRTETLDSGPKLDLRSLALSGDQLTWTNDGVSKSAKF